LLVAEAGGKIVGFCSVGRSREDDADESMGELYALYVDAQLMNQGVGSQLLAAGQTHLRNHGFAQATLWVLESNHHARRFYEGKGWTADGIRRTEEIGNVQVPEVRYAIRFADG
jgi:ribosomal protein S18 acetylase RimI-like enzyme